MQDYKFYLSTLETDTKVRYNLYNIIFSSFLDAKFYWLSATYLKYFAPLLTPRWRQIVETGRQY